MSTTTPAILSLAQVDLLRWANSTEYPLKLSRHDHITVARCLVRKGYFSKGYGESDPIHASAPVYAITELGRQALVDHDEHGKAQHVQD